MAVQALQTRTAEKKRPNPGKSRQQPFLLRKSQIRNFLDAIRENGRAASTVKKYQSDLNRFYEFLGEEKRVSSDSLPLWKADMIAQGYAERSINASIVAVNCLYDYLGCWEWQCSDWMELKTPEGPELSREEYLRLLQEAKRQENIQLYLLVKILACTELTPSDISLITREAINQGAITGKTRGVQGDLRIPETLQDDLLNYAIHKGIRSGPVFLGVSKKPLERTLISKMISILGEDAGLPSGKANPRNLRRMYLNTLADYQKQADLWVSRQFSALLMEEESSAGWLQPAGAKKRERRTS